MQENHVPYALLKSALSSDEISELVAACKRQMESLGIPCYGLIDLIDRPVFIKLQRLLEAHFGEPLFYLNDFYIYTDESFRTAWHVDTELFTFERAVNAWILLSPSHIDDPLGFMGGINESSGREFHKMRVEDDGYAFEDYFSGEESWQPKAAIEGLQVHTPRIQIGDVIAFDPKKFHRTNASVAKHALSIKFLIKGRHGFLSSTQVDPFFWPEVGLFNRLVKAGCSWDEVLEGLRRHLKDPSTREQLSAGFYPEKFGLYRRMIQQL